MNITVVCDVLGEENNGTVIAAMNLIRFLKKQNHKVTVLCADQSKKGQEGYYVVPNRSFGKLLDKYVAKVGITLPKADDNIIQEAIKDADIIHCMLPFEISMHTLKFARERNIPVTAGFHMQAENLTCYIKLNKWKFANHFVYKFIYKHFYKYVDAIHYPTKFMQDTFESHIKKQTPAFVISNGVHNYVQRRETPKPEELKDKIVILTTGRYAREKSQDTLIKAVRYSKYKDKIQLILGGQGVKEKYYKKLGKKLPIEPIYKFYSRTEIIDVLNYADMYVHPAEMELEGISCIEAIACGKLTIVSDSKLSATRNFAIDQKCIFKKRNPKDLARVIDYWIEHPEEAKEYEKKYLESAISFDQDECMKKMEQMLFAVYKYKKAQDKTEENK